MPLFGSTQTACKSRRRDRNPPHSISTLIGISRARNGSWARSIRGRACETRKPGCGISPLIHRLRGSWRTRSHATLIADDPPPAATARLEKVFLRTGGDLRAIALAIISEPAAWQHYFIKVRTPIELIVSAARATGFHERNSERLFDLSEQLSQRPFDAQSPAGFPDRCEDWMGGQAVLERVDFCAEFAATDVRSVHPATLARDILGPQASAATLAAITRAPSRVHAIGLMLASREFQRR